MWVFLGPDFYTDMVIVETVDQARLKLQLSYNWYVYNFYNKHINEIENNFECILTTFNHRFSVFNVCCGCLILLHPDLPRALYIDLRTTINKHCKPVIDSNNVIFASCVTVGNVLCIIIGILSSKTRLMRKKQKNSSACQILSVMPARP